MKRGETGIQTENPGESIPLDEFGKWPFLVVNCGLLKLILLALKEILYEVRMGQITTTSSFMESSTVLFAFQLLDLKRGNK